MSRSRAQQSLDPVKTSGRFATNCAATYRLAEPPTRKLFNNAVLDASRSATATSPTSTTRAPFDLLFSGSGFEYRTVVELRGFEPLTPCMP